MQLRVIWNPVLQPDPEGPTLISHAAWCSRTLLKSSFYTFVAHSRPHNGSRKPLLSGGGELPPRTIRPRDRLTVRVH